MTTPDISERRDQRTSLNCNTCGSPITETPWMYSYIAFDRTKVLLSTARIGTATQDTFLATDTNHTPFQVQICRECADEVLKKKRRQGRREKMIGLAIGILMLLLLFLAVRQGAGERMAAIVISIVVILLVPCALLWRKYLCSPKQIRFEQYRAIAEGFETHIMTRDVLRGRGFYKRDVAGWNARYDA